jgi:hypothetical protein
MENRKTFVHGKMVQEAKEKLRAMVEDKVIQIYNKPPKLAPRYQRITDIPLQHQLNRSTTELQDWVSRIQHQVKVTEFLNVIRPPGQLTLKQAYARNTLLLKQRHKFPPWQGTLE